MSLERINSLVEELYGQWKSLQPLKPEDYERLWKKIRLEWNYHSNRIEGNTLTYSETELLLVHGRAEGGHPIRDYEEMTAHNLGIEKVREYSGDDERCLTEADIRDLNRIILVTPFLKEAETPDGIPTRKRVVPGKYKTQPNHVRTATGELFKFALPEEVPSKMKELMDWFNENMDSSTIPIASFLAELHHKFILVHPFDDGNGRVARLWMNYALMRLGYPPIVINSDDREGYISVLQKADVGNIDALAVYLGETLLSWLEVGIKSAKGEDISESEDVDKKVAVFIERQKAKGRESNTGESLIKKDLEKLWILLFENFERKFEQFNQLFDSSETYGHGSEGGWRQELKKYVDNWTLENPTIRFGILYQGYKRPEPFSVQAELSIRRMPYHEFEYTIKVAGPSISEEKKRNGLLTDEIEKFVAEGKEDFLKVLEKITRA